MQCMLCSSQIISQPLVARATELLSGANKICTDIVLPHGGP